MSSWIDKIKAKVVNLVGPKGHIEWSTWMTIWDNIKAKEGIAQPPWVEFQMGANSEFQKFEKISFGQLENHKPVLGKITLEYFPGTSKELHLYKNNSEICSTQSKEAEQFWSELRKSSYLSLHKALAPYLGIGRLKLADDFQIEQEQKILQWIKASITTLRFALKRVEGAQHEFVTARILLGKLPLQESLHVIIHCFNLEIVLLSTEAKAWKLLAYDHKEADGTGVSSKPSLNSLVEVQLSNIWAELDQLVKIILKI